MYVTVDINRKGGIAISNFVVMVTMIRNNISVVPDVLTCGGCYIYVVVVGQRSHCWSCHATGNLSKPASERTGKRFQHQLHQQRQEKHR